MRLALKLRAARALKQLELAFPPSVAAASHREVNCHSGSELESQARELLRLLGADELATKIRVEWNPRLKTCAGRADYREKLISLNPELRNLDSVNGHSSSEVDRTLRHELAHLLAQWREKRHRIAPHGEEWHRACRDLGIADEARCHDLPFAAKTCAARYVYVCPNCQEKFPRVRRIRRAIACLACCRKHNGGDFDPRFRLRLISSLCRRKPVA